MNLGRLVAPSHWRSLGPLRTAAEQLPAAGVHRKRHLLALRKSQTNQYALTSVLIIAALVLVVYATLFGNFRVHKTIDTPWYLSYSYNFCMKGTDTDAVFGLTFPHGPGGTLAFGKLAAMLQCAALSPFDWSLAAANVLSVAGVVLSMTAIFAFLVGQGFGRLEAVTCCLALAVTEPFIAMANQSKYEYITFLLAVCALLLAARRQFFLAGLISMLAIEVQPIGIMAPVYLVAYELSRMIQIGRFRLELDRVAKLALGGVLGLTVYFILHPHILALLAASSNPAEWKQGSIHFLYGYFFETRLYRHLPELAVFAACLLVHIWRRDYIQWPFPIIASLATLFVGFFLHHHNGFYAPFWYFPSFLLAFMTISVAWRAVALPALVLVLFVPMYVVAYVEGRKYAGQNKLWAARPAIANLGTELSHAYIFGDFIFWPVFKDLSFEWTPLVLHHLRGIPRAPIYLICGLDPPFSPEESVCADALPAFGSMQLVERFVWASRKYLIYERRE